MDIKQLISFVTVARTNNMAEAAMYLNYSHSTVYGHLGNLEKEFHIKLYNRTPHGIELTKDGEKFFSYANKMVNLYYEMENAFLADESVTLNISTSETSNFCLMNRLLQEFLKQEPDVKLEHTKMLSDVSCVQISSGLCDLSVVCEYDFHPKDVMAEYLGTLPLVFVTLPKYLESQITKNSPEEITWPVLYGTMYKHKAQEMLKLEGIDLEERFASFSDIGDLPMIKQMLYYKCSVALLPEAYVKAELDNGTLTRIPSLMQEIKLDAFVVTPLKKIKSKARKMADLAFELYNPKRIQKNFILQ